MLPRHCTALRHGVATYLVDDGKVLKAQARLGHRDPSTTLRQYSQAVPLDDRAAVKRTSCERAVTVCLMSMRVAGLRRLSAGRTIENFCPWTRTSAREPSSVADNCRATFARLAVERGRGGAGGR